MQSEHGWLIQSRWLITGKLSDFIPLKFGATQNLAIRRKVKAHQAWHCSTEIPRYRPMLANLSEQLGQPMS